MDNLEQQHLAAIESGKQKTATSARAKSVSFDRKNRRLVVELENGATFMVPVSLVQILHDASDEQIADVRLKVHGLYLSWEQLDEDLTLEHLISGVFGTQKRMNDLRQHLAAAGRKGGVSRSVAKSRASAINGKKGGRPRRIA